MSHITEDPQDPLPDPSFPWRRALTFLASVGLWGLLYLVIARLPAGDVLAYARGVMLLLALVWLLYFAGASAADITRLLATLKLRLRGPHRQAEVTETDELPSDQRIGR